MLTRKEHRRIEAQILVDEAVLLDGKRVKRLPSFRDVACGRCGHKGRARIPFGTKHPRFKCSKCGMRN